MTLWRENWHLNEYFDFSDIDPEEVEHVMGRLLCWNQQRVKMISGQQIQMHFGIDHRILGIGYSNLSRLVRWLPRSRREIDQANDSGYNFPVKQIKLGSLSNYRNLTAIANLSDRDAIVIDVSRLLFRRRLASGATSYHDKVANPRALKAILRKLEPIMERNFITPIMILPIVPLYWHHPCCQTHSTPESVSDKIRICDNILDIERRHIDIVRYS